MENETCWLLINWLQIKEGQAGEVDFVLGESLLMVAAGGLTLSPEDLTINQATGTKTGNQSGFRR